MKHIDLELTKPMQKIDSGLTAQLKMKDKKTVSITIRLEEDLKDTLQKFADYYNMSVSEYIRLILMNHWKIEP